MIIKEIGRDAEVEVYGLYWVGDKRYHLCIPYDGCEGFQAISEDDCELVDPEIKRTFVLLRSAYGGEVLVVKEAADDGLIHDLIEWDPEAMRQFQQRLTPTQA